VGQGDGVQLTKNMKTLYKKLPILSDKIANWYPRMKNKELCPVFGCVKGQVRDKKTHLLRTCVVCNGDGLMPKKKKILTKQ